MCNISTCGCMEFCSSQKKRGYCEKVMYNDEACEPCSKLEPTG